jgi:MFS family permease
VRHSATELQAGITQAGVWPRRYTVVGLLTLATAICYVDRVNISIAIIPLARDKGYDTAASGLILSSFFWGYIGPQMLGGWLADRFGGKRVLMAGVVLWSLGTLLTPPSAAISFGALLLMRGLLGLGESVHFPAVHSIAARWTIASERSRAISLYVSGVPLGTVVALLASPIIVLSLGWPVVFYISGVLGFLWIAAWMLKAADDPENCPGERAGTGRNTGGPSPGAAGQVDSVGGHPARKARVGNRHCSRVKQLWWLHRALVAPKLSSQNLRRPDGAAGDLFHHTLDCGPLCRQPQRMDC